MSKKLPQFLEYFLQDCLNGDNQFSMKSMFSGYGIYKNKKIFAIYAMGELYFKVGTNNLEYFLEKKASIFSYTKKGKIAKISYYTLPEEIMENRKELDIWIERSLEVSTKTKQRKKSKKDLELDQKILESLLEIPAGKVTTYKNLADKFGVHSRRIASVMKMNKHPDIYPCYKVISHSGKLSGYSGPDGTNSKIKMLETDGVEVVNGTIDDTFIV